MRAAWFLGCVSGDMPAPLGPVEEGRGWCRTRRRGPQGSNDRRKATVEPLVERLREADAALGALYQCRQRRPMSGFDLVGGHGISTSLTVVTVVRSAT